MPANPALVRLAERVFKRAIRVIAERDPREIEDAEIVCAILSKVQPHTYTAEIRADGDAFVRNIVDGMIAEDYFRREGTKLVFGSAVRLGGGIDDIRVDAGGGRMVKGSKNDPKLLPPDNGRGRGRHLGGQEWMRL